MVMTLPDIEREPVSPVVDRIGSRDTVLAMARAGTFHAFTRSGGDVTPVCGVSPGAPFDKGDWPRVGRLMSAAGARAMGKRACRRCFDG